jgi:predicted AlkP superfamily pyrophosphatase or phosphodiesterase
VAPPPPPAAAPTAIVISIDALNPDAVSALGAAEIPNIFRFIDEGSSTNNARTVVESTNTLPNHLSMVTGRPVLGVDGHLVTFNEDDGLTIHSTAGQYVAGMFDVAHDHGLDTLLYASKPKFDFLDRSWDATNGAADVTGADDGTDKIDFYMRSDGATITNSFVAQMGVDVVELSLIHYGITDGEAHAFGFESPEYEQALRDVDGWIGQILATVESDPLLAEAVIILATDHSGSGFEHGDETAAVNYTIPLYVWGPGIAAGSDIYTETGATRLDPGTTQPAYTDPVPPVRNADIANLALEVLDLGPVPGSVINSSQDLNVIP